MTKKPTQTIIKLQFFNTQKRTETAKALKTTKTKKIILANFSEKANKNDKSIKHY